MKTALDYEREIDEDMMRTSARFRAEQAIRLAANVSAERDKLAAQLRDCGGPKELAAMKARIAELEAVDQQRLDQIAQWGNTINYLRERIVALENNQKPFNLVGGTPGPGFKLGAAEESGH